MQETVEEESGLSLNKDFQFFLDLFSNSIGWGIRRKGIRIHLSLTVSPIRDKNLATRSPLPFKFIA